VVPGNAKCHWCFKGKKGCKFPVEEEEVLEDEEDVEEAPTVSKLPVASLKKLISSHSILFISAKKLTYCLNCRRRRLLLRLLPCVLGENCHLLSFLSLDCKSLCHLFPCCLLGPRVFPCCRPLWSLLNHKPQSHPVSSSHLKITACASYKLLCANPKKISTLRGTDLQAGSPCTLIKLQSWRSKWVREVLLVASR
jgi:hypothetical protein